MSSSLTRAWNIVGTQYFSKFIATQILAVKEQSSAPGPLSGLFLSLHSTANAISRPYFWVFASFLKTSLRGPLTRSLRSYYARCLHLTISPRFTVEQSTLSALKRPGVLVGVEQISRGIGSGLGSVTCISVTMGYSTSLSFFIPIFSINAARIGWAQRFLSALRLFHVNSMVLFWADDQDGKFGERILWGWCKARVRKARATDEAVLATRLQDCTPDVWTSAPLDSSPGLSQAPPGRQGALQATRQKPAAAQRDSARLLRLPEAERRIRNGQVCGGGGGPGGSQARRRRPGLAPASGGAPWTKQAAVRAAEASARAWTAWTSRPTAASSWWSASTRPSRSCGSASPPSARSRISGWCGTSTRRSQRASPSSSSHAARRPAGPWRRCMAGASAPMIPSPSRCGCRVGILAGTVCGGVGGMGLGPPFPRSWVGVGQWEPVCSRERTRGHLALWGRGAGRTALGRGFFRTARAPASGCRDPGMGAGRCGSGHAPLTPHAHGPQSGPRDSWPSSGPDLLRGLLWPSSLRTPHPPPPTPVDHYKHRWLLFHS